MGTVGLTDFCGKLCCDDEADPVAKGSVGEDATLQQSLEYIIEVSDLGEVVMDMGVGFAGGAPRTQADEFYDTVSLIGVSGLPHEVEQHGHILFESAYEFDCLLEVGCGDDHIAAAAGTEDHS